MTFEDLMDYAISRNCSDVHITQGTNLAVRRYGELIILDEIPTFEEARDMIYSSFPQMRSSVLRTAKMLTSAA